MSDLIAEYEKSGLVSDPKKYLRPCDDCGTKCHDDDLHTIDINQNGEHATMEICDGCKGIRDTNEEENRLAFSHDAKGCEFGLW